MSLSGTLRELSRLFEYWEANGWDVVDVSDNGSSMFADDEFRVDVDIRSPLCDLIESTTQYSSDDSVTVDSEMGTIDVRATMPIVPESLDTIATEPPRDIVVEPVAVRLSEDNHVETSISVHGTVTRSTLSSDRPPVHNDVDTQTHRSNNTQSTRDENNRSNDESPRQTENGSNSVNESQKESRRQPSSAVQSTSHSSGERRGDESPTDESTASSDTVHRRNPDVPPFEDVDYLDDVYRTYETFGEMAEAIEMDVTAETVRRYMIDAGVHEPKQYNTQSDSKASQSTASNPQREAVDTTRKVDGNEQTTNHNTQRGGDPDTNRNPKAGSQVHKQNGLSTDQTERAEPITEASTEKGTQTTTNSRNESAASARIHVDERTNENVETEVTEAGTQPDGDTRSVDDVTESTEATSIEPNTEEPSSESKNQSASMEDAMANTEPAASATSAGRDAESEKVLVTDGIGLPNDVSVEEFIDIVAGSKTLYEVQTQLNVERGTAHELLRKYNLLDLVMGQLTMESHRNVTRGEIIDRLQQTAP